MTVDPGVFDLESIRSVNNLPRRRKENTKFLAALCEIKRVHELYR